MSKQPSRSGSSGSPSSGRVEQIAQVDAEIWKGHGYFDDAEQYMNEQWNAHVWPMIQGCDFSRVLDLATGHGRNATKLKELATELILVDILQENIDYCRNRFGNDPKIRYIVNDGSRLNGVDDASISLLYCFDAMVHFDSDVVRSYLGEFHRVLKPGARGFCHHSNYTERPTGDFRTNPCARNFMSKALFEHYAHKEGLRVLQSRTIQWSVPELDCLTLFEKPAK